MFLEKDPAAYGKLKEFADQVKDVEIKTENADLESAIGKIVAFVKAGGRSSFPFIFIDPTGWTGAGIKLIAPLLCVKPGEVLINFMTDFIKRFFDLSRENFADLFGQPDSNPALATLWHEYCEKTISRISGIDTTTTSEQEREDLLLQAYAEDVRRTGGFKYACPAVVLYPDRDRSYFHLIYATRNLKGVEVFKQVEKQAMQVMEKTRAEIKERKRIKKTNQPGLFDAEFMPHSRPIDALRGHYLQRAQECVREALAARRKLYYDQAWEIVLGLPLVWESDLKDWIRDWKKKGLVDVGGLKPNQKVPKLNQKNVLTWLETS